MKLMISTAAAAIETVVAMAITMLVSVFIVALVALPHPGSKPSASVVAAAKVQLAESISSLDSTPNG